MTETELYEFLGDPLLVELQERARIADDVLDIINLTETQHSSILVWCLTPGEGHGQGDAVLKDLLLAVHREAENPVYDNKKCRRRSNIDQTAATPSHQSPRLMAPISFSEEYWTRRQCTCPLSTGSDRRKPALPISVNTP